MTKKNIRRRKGQKQNRRTMRKVKGRGKYTNVRRTKSQRTRTKKNMKGGSLQEMKKTMNSKKRLSKSGLTRLALAHQKNNPLISEALRAAAAAKEKVEQDKSLRPTGRKKAIRNRQEIKESREEVAKDSTKPKVKAVDSGLCPPPESHFPHLSVTQMEQIISKTPCDCSVCKKFINKINEQAGDTFIKTQRLNLDTNGRGAIGGDGACGSYPEWYEEGVKYILKLLPLRRNFNERINFKDIFLTTESNVKNYTGNYTLPQLNDYLFNTLLFLAHPNYTFKKGTDSLCPYCGNRGANTIEHTRGQVKAHLYFGDLWGYFMGIPMCNSCQNGRVNQFCDSVLVMGGKLYVLQKPPKVGFQYQPLTPTDKNHQIIFFRCLARNLECLISRHTRKFGVFTNSTLTERNNLWFHQEMNKAYLKSLHYNKLVLWLFDPNLGILRLKKNFKGKYNDIFGPIIKEFLRFSPDAPQGLPEDYQKLRNRSTQNIETIKRIIQRMDEGQHLAEVGAIFESFIFKTEEKKRLLELFDFNVIQAAYTLITMKEKSEFVVQQASVTQSKLGKPIYYSQKGGITTKVEDSIPGETALSKEQVRELAQFYQPLRQPSDAVLEEFLFHRDEIEKTRKELETRLKVPIGPPERIFNP